MPAASRGLRLAGLARFLPAVNLRRHAACEPLDAGAQAPAKERRGGAPPKFAAAARVHGVMGARKQCSGRHSAAARAPAHLGVAVGAAWVVYSVAGRTPWPSSPRAAPHTLPPPPIILAFRGVRAFSNLTVNGDSNPWPPHSAHQARFSEVGANCSWVFPPYTRVSIFPQKSERSEPPPQISLKRYSGILPPRTGA